MADRRETITAVLRVKDAGRFKAVIKSVKRDINDLGDEASKTSRKFNKLQRSMHLNTVTASVLKDRMSLTRGEIMTTAITVGSYLTPALIALGSSATAAAVGGALVAGGGLTALLAGLSGFILIAKGATQGFTKVKAAQDAYNLAVSQFGVGSLEAARASGRLYAVIQNNGGMPVWRAVQATHALGVEWRKLSAPGRRDVFRMITDGVKAATRILPTFARESNRNMGVIRKTFSGIVTSLSGHEMETNLRAFSRTFRIIAGPLGRGATNIIIVMLRIFRAILPTVEIIAKKFEGWTDNMRRWSSNARNVDDWVIMLVGHFWSWWHLAKALGKTLGILFEGSQKDGQGLVDTLATQIDKLNIWLEKVRDTGELKKFFQSFITTVEDFGRTFGNVFTAFVDFGRRMSWLKDIFDKFGVSVGDLAAAFVAYKAAMILTTVAVGGFKLAIIAIQGAVILAQSSLALLRISMAATTAAAGLETTAMIAAYAGIGTLAGAAFAAAFAIAAAGIVVLIGWKIGQEVKERQGLTTSLDDYKKNHPDAKRGIEKFFPSNIAKSVGGKIKNLAGFAGGGVLGIGGSAIVGEKGPEVATAGPRGTVVSPISRGIQPAPSPIDWPEINGVIHVHVNTSVKVNRREIMQANGDAVADRKARRGER